MDDFPIWIQEVAMKDYLHTQLSEQEVFGMSMLGLAHMGDAVFDLLIRARECARGVATAK